MLKVFLTGCDNNTEWQLPWFVHNYRKHNTTPLVLADFGMSKEARTIAEESPIFNLSEYGKLGMVKDRPWSTRRSELGSWYNSGVVLVENTPNILKMWADECIRNPVQGDQEVLYIMMGGDEITKMSYIKPLPHTYNTLRLDYIDNIEVKNPKIIHHTGSKGNEVIRRQIDELST